ncbi:MAG: PilZ domain-containing protein [Bdellovibrio sp.]|nr:PilZ domain-containing protein [Bdellovibrio sp.]
MKTKGKVWLFYDAEKKVQSKAMSVVQAQVFLLSLKKKDHVRYFVWTPGWAEWTCIRDFLKSDQTTFVITQPPKPMEVTKTAVPAPPSAEGDDENTAILNAPDTSSQTDPNYTTVVAGSGPVRAQDFGYYHQDFTGDDLDLSKIRKMKAMPKKKTYDSKEADSKTEDADRRGATRHNFKIEVVLVSKYKSFRTYSKDISLSGTQLENEIPHDFLNHPFDLIIVNPYEKDPSKARLLFRAKIVGDMTDPRRLMFIEQDVEMTLKLDALLKAYVAYQEAVRKSAG